MIGRIVSIEGPPATIADLARNVAPKAMQTLKSLPGIGTLHVMMDPENGRVAVVTTWSDAQTASAAISAMAGLRQTVEQGGGKISIADYSNVIA